MQAVARMPPMWPSCAPAVFGWVLRYYLLKPITSLSCSLNAVFPGLKMWDTFACATVNYLTHFIFSIAVLENVPPDEGVKKRTTFSTLNIGLAGTGNRDRDTCVASSGTNRSAIYYAFCPSNVQYGQLELEKFYLATREIEIDR
jgi:hypothetical protein